jgi:hypothetical protein
VFLFVFVGEFNFKVLMRKSILQGWVLDMYEALLILGWASGFYLVGRFLGKLRREGKQSRPRIGIVEGE